MKAQRFLLLLIILVVGLVFALPATSRTTGIIVTDANSVLEIPVSVSSGLLNAVANISPRFVVQYANTIKYYRVAIIPSQLQELLALIPSRVTIQSANSNRTFSLNYPITLIEDPTPPQISNVSATGQGTIRWTTDEFSTSMVRYGTQPTVYPYSISNTLYTDLHIITLNNLIPGTVYYYKIYSTDRSGNTVESSEYRFTASVYLFLPLVIRK